VEFETIKIEIQNAAQRAKPMAPPFFIAPHKKGAAAT
jgi:hypothetical protein